MIMINNPYPYTDKPVGSFFPQGLYKDEVIQKLYLNAFTRNTGVFKFTYNWLFPKTSPTQACLNNAFLNTMNRDLILKYLEEN